MMKRRTILTSGLALGTFAVCGSRLAFGQELTKDEVFNDKDAPFLGNPKGDVTVVEFFDYQCPYCKKAHPMVKKVIERDGNVKLVMKDWPIFGDASIFAAQAVLGAAQIGKYEIAMGALMKTKGKLTHDDIESTLTAAGLSMDEIAVAVNKHVEKISGLLDRNYAQATAFNFAGTPAYVIGWSLYPGVLDEKGLVDAIARARQG
ncbi:thioredoxin domain-containing protein [Agrobacterium sp. MA01]|uniref:DsbA family protein n=1 Tax=Agrobacterium sp. MA01 TaxID=2664893 RepID=UPI00129A8E03|nr:DsbA family protein [Agrobacterium sp. MA01]QGG92013.1 thioredoxin domain-containing protein [Agrobacterium sp. MA01]